MWSGICVEYVWSDVDWCVWSGVYVERCVWSGVCGVMCKVVCMNIFQTILFIC